MKAARRSLFAVLVIFATPLFAHAATHIVTQNGVSFSPSSIIIEVGDTVQWNWTGGIHTVTSGASLVDPQLGNLFDAPLNSINPTFSFVFTNIGTAQYLCRPHFGLNMTGTVTIESPSAVDGIPVAKAALLTNAPNPFNPTTKITFELPSDRMGAIPVSLKVYDLKGRLVRTLVNRSLDVDRYTVTWNGRDDQGRSAPSGAYIYRLVADGQSLGRLMTLAK